MFRLDVFLKKHGVKSTIVPYPHKYQEQYTKQNFVIYVIYTVLVLAGERAFDCKLDTNWLIRYEMLKHVRALGEKSDTINKGLIIKDA